MSITVHGLTRSKEIVNFMADAGVGIPYKEVMRLYDSWAMHDVKKNLLCPGELTEGKPGAFFFYNLSAFLTLYVQNPGC